MDIRIEEIFSQAELQAFLPVFYSESAEKTDFYFPGRTEESGAAINPFAAEKPDGFCRDKLWIKGTTHLPADEAGGNKLG